MPEAETLTTLTTLFTDLLGDIPPEFESLVYVFFVFILIYILDMFFHLLFSIFKLR